MTQYRVVQWATGNVGQRALRAILDRDEFELVGVHAYSPDKVGQDVGTLAGIAPVGVLATDNVDALIGQAPDCVLYTPRVIDYALVARLLRAGINVVTTGDFLTGTHHLEELAALTAAAQHGGTTFLGTGFEPGFINVVAGFLSGACRRVHSVKLVETLDCTQYPVREAWTVSSGSHYFQGVLSRQASCPSTTSVALIAPGRTAGSAGRRGAHNARCADRSDGLRPMVRARNRWC